MGAVTFTIGDVAYVGLGIDQYANELKDFWTCTLTGQDLIWQRAETLPDDFKPRYGATALCAECSSRR